MNYVAGPVTYAPAVAELLLARSGLPPARAAALARELASTHGHRIPEQAIRAAVPTTTRASSTRAATPLACPPGCHRIQDMADSYQLDRWQTLSICRALQSAQDPEPFTPHDCVTSRDFHDALKRVRAGR